MKKSELRQIIREEIKKLQEAKRWKVYIDDKQSQFFDVNYILRGMVVPEGKHKIDFYFEPEIVKLGINVRLISILLTFSFIAYMFYKKTKR